jgi:hypothetical protein
VRAYPRLHRAFYAVMTRNPAVRDMAGRVKDRVRSSAQNRSPSWTPTDDPAVLRRRESAVATRLGLRVTRDGDP